MVDPRDRSNRVLTADEQARLSPNEVLRLLREGNDRFVNADTTHRDHQAQIRAALVGQWPKAVVLSCLDSRIPVEDVFDCGIGDLFVARVAGNIVNVDILGSMEFACAVAGAKVVLVLGHEHCGAIKGAIDKVELGNLSALLGLIRPSVDAVEFAGDRTSKDEAFVHRVAEHNVRRTVARIRAESPVLAEREAAGTIAIVGAMYDMDSGHVSFDP
jgi:carbonic anhydrase